MTPNPATHPEEFDKVGQSDILLEDDIYKNGISLTWTPTIRAGWRCSISGLEYFRRKPKQKEPMKYYRQLEYGERKQSGDLRANGSYDAGKPLQPVSFPGEIHSRETYGIALRPVEVDEWVSQRDQPVTREDFKPSGYINVLYGDNTLRTVPESDLSHMFTHWRRITPPAPQEKPIILNESGTSREVVMSRHGVTVGCVGIDPSTMDRIVEKWQKTKREDGRA